MKLLTRLLLLLILFLAGEQGDIYAHSLGDRISFFPANLAASDHDAPVHKQRMQRKHIDNLPRALSHNRKRKVAIIDNEDEDDEPAGARKDKDTRPLFSAEHYFLSAFCPSSFSYCCNYIKNRLTHGRHAAPVSCKPYVLLQVFRI